ncbi:ABC transporter [Actinomycetales bacterium SN12]|nr:ABC transporter [Actinomycetales bacterium SN12]
MSDPEVPKNEQHHDVDDVVGRANEGLDAAAAARADVPSADAAAKPADPDMEAFAAAERDYPGTFGAPGPVDSRDGFERSTEGRRYDAARREDDSISARPTVADVDPVDAPHIDEHRADEIRADEHGVGEHSVGEHGVGEHRVDDVRVDDVRVDEHRDEVVVTELHDTTASVHPTDTRDGDATRDADTTRVIDTDRPQHHTVADTAYASPTASAAETQVVPAEPVAPPAAPQPIFVQAPEPPRELGNRGTAGAIGLVAAVAFAILYLAAILGFGALRGDVTVENIGTAALEPLMTWSFWVPVVVFFLSFWLLGAFINRARWGKWVIFGVFVAIATYGGYILGQLFQAPFWRITATESVELVNEQLLAPLAIASFIFARELTIWFGAWVARSGVKKKALNAEAQAEYERTLEAGPSALR